MGLCAALLAIVGLRHRLKKGAPMADSKKIVRRLLEEPWKGNWDVIEESVTSGYIGYDPALPEPVRGPAGIKANFQQYIDAFTGAQITVDEQIAEGDKVATRWTGRGTHTGEFNGIAPTGKEVTISGQTISRLEGGKIVEERTNWDTLGILVQLGAVPATARV
jgi:ketosteroid isomerase-like protein